MHQDYTSSWKIVKHSFMLLYFTMITEKKAFCSFYVLGNKFHLFWEGDLKVSPADNPVNPQSSVTNAEPYSWPCSSTDSWRKSHTYTGDQKYLETEAYLLRDKWTAEKMLWGMEQPKVQLQEVHKAKTWQSWGFGINKEVKQSKQILLSTCSFCFLLLHPNVI